MDFNTNVTKTNVISLRHDLTDLSEEYWTMCIRISISKQVRYGSCFPTKLSKTSKIPL